MRYALIEGTSSKFWEIELKDRSFTVAWGRIGTKGQSQTKTFPSSERAKREHDKLVAEKVKKGYRVVGSTIPAASKKPAPKRTSKTKADAKPKATAAAKPKAKAAAERAKIAAAIEAVRSSSSKGKARKGASVAALALLEKKIGRSLPGDLRELLALGDGGVQFGDWTFLSTIHIAKVHAIWCKLVGEVVDDEDDEPTWDRRWTPFADSSTGDSLCLTAKGDVIVLYHADTRRPVFAPSLSAALDTIAVATAAKRDPVYYDGIDDDDDDD
jgi:predicted DNA-binding WGR domain protein/cell wall assembly regulator SMI1